MGPYPIRVNGTSIMLPGVSDIQEAHRLFRTTILDGQVPVRMPIGFTINSYKHPGAYSILDRNKSCQEATVAIATNISGIIFVGNEDSICVSEEKAGVITTGNVLWTSKGKASCTPVNKDRYLLTALDPVAILFHVAENTGFRSMAENSKLIKRGYFPLNTVHSLNDYIRVLPEYSDHIEVRYFNGMTPELFERIWNE